MQHPISKNKYGFLVFLAGWLFFVTMLFTIAWYFEERTAYQAFTNSMSFCLPLLILAPCIWFVVVYTSFENSGVFGFILNHIGSLVIVTAIWLSVSYHLHNFLWGQEEIDGVDLIIPLHWQIFLAFFTYDYIVMVYYLIIYYRNFKDKLVRETELKDLVKEAELSALKSQINPHFLFNSLNSVSSLTISKPELSREMLVKLSTFLRYSLAQDVKELNSLTNELSNVRLYMEIEKVRFGDRLQMDFDLSEVCEPLKIPNLILQPLYENAIKYGVHESLEPVSVKTKCSFENGFLKISIGNNFDSESIPPKGNGIGLHNIQERLRLIYARTDLMKIVRSENYFTVNLEFPQNL
ncbi:sensor histidine kinase [Labilibaculum sp.]|uniref:sensor histidine kinase n=1 Tax=Labilibaculum sp. TaxID=2060723 RepID=UPI003563BB70